MRSLAEAIEVFYEQMLQAVADSPAQGVCWGGNFDDMITYAPYFEKELLPWLQKAGDVLRARGKIIDCHCDGENLGLMEVIKAARIDVAEAVCPYPMTKVTLGEYYRGWGQNTTIFGGIPSNILVAELTTDEEFEAYLDDIGKNMVLTMMRSVGFEVIDLGTDVPVETFVAQVNAHRPAILGLSALLTTTMPQMKRVIDALTEAGIRNEVKVIIGGAPVNQRYAKNIGADGYARDAGEAVVLAKNILNRHRQ
jgi:methylmalonyl-CoA mutase cobalamin-binding subunit